MIKKLLCFGLMTFSSTSLLAQSMDLKPSDLQIPRVTAFSTCAVADYGKIMFITGSTNKAYVCSGSGWVAIEQPTLTLPFSGSGVFPIGLSVQNNSTAPNSSAIDAYSSSSASNTYGLRGFVTSTAPQGNTFGVYGVNYSTNQFGFGVYGNHLGSGSGVYGQSVTGYGVQGNSGNGGAGGGTGVYGNAIGTGTNGVFGNASGTNSFGVLGKNVSSTGVAGYFEHTSPTTSVALQTTGKIRFQGNGAGVGKLLTCDNVNGNAEWKSFTRTEILKLSSASFQSHISQNESVMDSRGIYMSSANGSFHANVSVPDGATITQYKVYYVDNDATNGLTSYALQRLNHTGTTNSYFNVQNGTFTNSAASANILSVSNNLNEVVDNATSFYRVVITMPVSATLTLLGVEITYTYQFNN